MTRDEFIKHIENTKHDVSVEAFVWEEDRKTTARVESYTYPDGSPVNSLDAGELMAVAEMLRQTAKEMKSLQEGDSQ